MTCRPGQTARTHAGTLSESIDNSELHPSPTK